MYASKNLADGATPSGTLNMENLYQEWTLEQDQVLWENRNQSIVNLASLLGRGLQGVKSRLAKLSDVESPAYQRLFVGGRVDVESIGSKEKLAPASEVFRRIKYDCTLSPSDFTILYYDRVEDGLVEAPMDATNHSIKGTATMLIDALPQHRVVVIKYKDRVVWDREKRIDLVFSYEGIEEVIKTYDEWKQDRDQMERNYSQLKSEVSEKIQQILGFEGYTMLKQMSVDLQTLAGDSTVSTKQAVEKFLKEALELYRKTRVDPSVSLDPSLIPMNDCDAIDSLSEFVALMSDEQLRSTILSELALALEQNQGGKLDFEVHRELPKLLEKDLTETFVRGSGPGGQKINKTNNKVVLVHVPTEIRVECQDTRSLQINRKIARKRLLLKLDEYYNGSQSKTSIEAKKASEKKKKAKARTKARQRRKIENAHESDNLPC